MSSDDRLQTAKGDGGADLPAVDFTKMHGLGNDFIVIDNRDRSLALDAAAIRRLADRHRGVGFDQLLVVEPASVPEAEFDYRIFNADGGEVEHCGNGARCFARFVTDRGLTSSTRIPVNTMKGLLTLEVLEDGRVTVGMGVPTFIPAEVPFVAEPPETRGSPGKYHRIEVDGQELEVGVAGIGNPHVVLEVADVERAELERLGPLLESHPRFPERVNVGFLQIVDSCHVRLRVYERGVGETLACGTGACAAVAVGVMQEKLDRTVSVTLPGGELLVHWPRNELPIEMTGPCSTVFEGTTRLPACHPIEATTRTT